MSYTNFNMRLDNSLKASAYPVFEQYGLTASQAVRLFFNQVAKTGKLPLSLDFDRFLKLNIFSFATLRKHTNVAKEKIFNFKNRSKIVNWSNYRYNHL